MCNAYNHPYGCPCGFGGDTSSLNLKWISKQVYHPCYINPNAKCPVCGVSVYFFQSQYGGKVFFDDLWPEWTKHPCTDNRGNDVNYEFRRSAKLNLISSVYRPLLVLGIQDIGYSYKHKLIGQIVDENGNRIDLKKHLIYNFTEIYKYSFFYYNKTSETTFEIVCYDINGKNIKMDGIIELEYFIGMKLDLFYTNRVSDLYIFNQKVRFSSYNFCTYERKLKPATVRTIKNGNTNVSINAIIKRIDKDQIWVEEF
jgi:hypothetical protein